MSFFSRLIQSFDNTQAGYSARKLSAFAGVCISLWITFKITTEGTLVEVLLIWLLFALLCLGIVTVEQVIRFKEGVKREPIKTTTTETTTTETEVKAG